MQSAHHYRADFSYNLLTCILFEVANKKSSLSLKSDSEDFFTILSYKSYLLVDLFNRAFR